MSAGPEAVHDLLGRSLPDEGLTLDDVTTCCFGPGSELLGDDTAAAIVKFHDWGGYAAAWIIAVAVAPERRRRGVGRDLVEEAVTWAGARGASEVHLGTAIPRYLWPGVDFASPPPSACSRPPASNPTASRTTWRSPRRFAPIRHRA
ncbi:MAG: GNAT family N-acetyltransferase [Acidimicrobiia bacterium]